MKRKLRKGQEVHPTLSPSLWRPELLHSSALAGLTFLDRLRLSGAGHRRGPMSPLGAWGRCGGKAACSRSCGVWPPQLAWKF